MASGLVILLLATILITLLGVWGKIPGIIVGVVGFILFCVGVALTASYIGAFWAVTIWIGLPIGALTVFGFYEVACGRMDMWGKPIQKKVTADKPFGLFEREE